MKRAKAFSLLRWRQSALQKLTIRRSTTITPPFPFSPCWRHPKTLWMWLPSSIILKTATLNKETTNSRRLTVLSLVCFCFFLYLIRFDDCRYASLRSNRLPRSTSLQNDWQWVYFYKQLHIRGKDNASANKEKGR